jgi:hypothetical protein
MLENKNLIMKMAERNQMSLKYSRLRQIQQCLNSFGQQMTHICCPKLFCSQDLDGFSSTSNKETYNRFHVTGSLIEALTKLLPFIEPEVSSSRSQSPPLDYIS